ncbi:SCO6745 family protein [Nocardia farcinica]|uniref:SCO6745 family protein n=1 Tax=Nocardia farcinica TaxID=37329 RepID=UPI0018936626|nr:hypothetical protein [Nocardia farcinica]MBF6518703.1 hypothetical protein [Nocardia farcinica]
MAQPVATLARRLWEAIEPLHAVAYFSPHHRRVSVELGMSGYWMGYFAGRAAPLGALTAAPVTAMFFSFPERRVAHALPAAWNHADPATVLAARIETARTALAEHLGEVPTADIDTLARRLEAAVDGCDYGGRPLAAGWARTPRPDDPLGRLWLAATVLREHRGDGHVLACVHAGVSGIDAVVAHAATGSVSRELMQRNRGWRDAEWDAALRRLRARGLVDVTGRLTKAGGALRRGVEDHTDVLAADPVTILGPTGIEDILARAAPLSRRLFDRGAIPLPNPIGVPRP